MPELDGTYGRLRTPVLGPDEALYVATSNGGGSDRILKIVPGAVPERTPPSDSPGSKSNSISGGNAAISEAVQASLPEVEPFADIKRIAGSSRTDTAARAARLVLDGARERNTVMIVASGWSPPDIGIASALAARTPGALVVYTSPGALPAETRELVEGLQPGLVLIVGGTDAIPTAVQSEIAALLPAGARTQRISGQTRIHTSVNVTRSILPR